MSSHWYDRSVSVIDKVFASLPVDADAITIKKAVAEAYPFGARAHHPYKQWCRARKIMLLRRYPKLFSGKVDPGDAPLFGGRP